MAILPYENQIVVRKRPSQGLMGGLWEFPLLEVSHEKDLENQLSEELKQNWNLTCQSLKHFTTIKHTYTSFKATVHCYLGQGLKIPEELPSGQWHPIEELHQLPFPSFLKKLLSYLKENQIL